MQDKSNTVSVDVEKMLAELRVSYIAELPTRLNEIEDIILNLLNSASFTEDFQALYRNLHSMKGSAGTHNLHIITTVCHAFEDKVVDVKGEQTRFSKDKLDEWLIFVDLLRKTIDLISSGVENFSEIEIGLERLSGLGVSYEFKCLVITASELHRNLVSNAFEKYAMKFSYAINGYEALGNLLKESYDVVVTDMEVSDLQGLPIISALRLSNSRNKDIPSILLTSGKVRSYGKNIDPDYVIYKDADLIENLNLAVRNISSQLQA